MNKRKRINPHLKRKTKEMILICTVIGVTVGFSGLVAVDMALKGKVVRKIFIKCLF